MTVPAAVLVGATTFEPDDEQLRGLLDQLAALSATPLVFDNSVTRHEPVRRACEAAGVRYLRAGHNVGTAGALNAFLGEARHRGLPWLLYLDQDTRTLGGHDERLEAALDAVPPDVAMVGCALVQPGDDVAGVPRGSCFEDASFLIASGTLVRVETMVAVGGYDEDFGLDLVDHEACLRLRRAGHRLWRDPARRVTHEIGSGSRVVPLLGVRVARHPWWRRRAMWRNSVVLARRYFRADPLGISRHLVVRVVETLAAAVAFRDARFLGEAAAGVRRGLADGRRPRGAYVTTGE